MTHYYSEEQTSELNPIKIIIHIGEVSFEVVSGSGVFSRKKLDKGTETLLKNLVLKDGMKVLDLGCGIGVVGIYVKKVFPNINILLSDVNRRAVYLSKINFKNNNLKGKIMFSNGFDKIKESFNAILFNPPQVAGRKVCFSMIEGSFNHLEKDGLLEIVARHNKGGKMLSKKMLSLFGNVEEVAKSSGYRVYVSKKN